MTKVQQLSEFHPALRRRIHEDIAEQLRDAILDGRFAAGTKLPPERELALEFQVNRTSIRDAIKVLEGLNLVRVRQGDGATVQPIVDASFDLLAAMIFHRDRIDLPMITELLEVVRPLLSEMARLALERADREQIDQLRALSVLMAGERPDHQPHSATAQEVLLLLSDMTGNRVWQMLARRLRILLRSEALREMRQRIPVDFNRLSTLLNDSVEHHLAGRADQALAAMRRAVELVSERYELRERGKRRVRASRR